jgi:collagenase-like PrtC family protease
MKILSPLKSSEEVEPLITAGANSFYCGYIHNGKSYSAWDYDAANFKEITDLENAIKIAHKYGVPIYCTFNINRVMAGEELEEIAKRAVKLKGIGISGFIASNLLVISTLKGLGLRIILGSAGGAFNMESIKFYNEIGIYDVILPRYLHPLEVSILKKSSPKTNFYVHVYNIECPTNDIFCLLEDILNWKDFTTGCSVPAKKIFVSKGSLSLKEKKEIIRNIDLCSEFRNRCFLCSIYHLNKIGITSLVILGRSFSLKNKLESVNHLKDLLKGIDKNTWKEFFEKVIKITGSGAINCEGDRCIYYEKGQA